MNQRLWNRQKHRPALCKYCKRVKIVFLRNLHGDFIPCEAVKLVHKKDGQKVLDEQGIVSWMGVRFGWPVHNCRNEKTVVVDEQDVPLPEFEPVSDHSDYAD